MKIRTQLTLVVTLVVALVTAIAGVIILTRDDRRERSNLDAALAERATAVRSVAMASGELPAADGLIVRLLDKGELTKQVGSTATFPLTVDDGYSTVQISDAQWRSLGETLVSGAQFQILISLDNLNDRHDDNVLMVDLLVVLAAVLSALAVFFATGLVLRPFKRLLAATKKAGPEDLLPSLSSPRELAELTDELNALLERVRAARPAAEPAAAPHAVLSLPAPPRPAPPRPAPERSPAEELWAATVTTEMPRISEPKKPEPKQPEPTAEPEPELTVEIPSWPEPENEPEPVTEAKDQPAKATEAEVDVRVELESLGANLATLLGDPDMPTIQRHLILAAMAEEHRLLVERLDATRRAEEG